MCFRVLAEDIKKNERKADRQMTQAMERPQTVGAEATTYARKLSTQPLGGSERGPCGPCGCTTVTADCARCCPDWWPSE